VLGIKLLCGYSHENDEQCRIRSHSFLKTIICVLLGCAIAIDIVFVCFWLGAEIMPADAVNKALLTLV